MAAHSKKNANEEVKTYSFKVKACNNDLDKKIREAISEQQTYYNRCSDWIKNILMSKIGDLYKYIPEEKRWNSYAELLVSDEWRSNPVYMML